MALTTLTHPGQPRTPDVVIGVDTHKDVHVAVALAANGGRLGECLGQRLLQLDAHRHHDLADEIRLGRKVVDDDPVVDPQPSGEPSEREPAQPVVEGGGERSVEQLLPGVLVTHRT